jgi:hypothetical protein
VKEEVVDAVDEEEVNKEEDEEETEEEEVDEALILAQSESLVGAVAAAAVNVNEEASAAWSGPMEAKLAVAALSADEDVEL